MLPENLRVAQICLESALYNPTVQNAQQAAEKALKAFCLLKGLSLTKTHSIHALRKQALKIGFDCGLTDEECDLLDSVYLPSKYPVGTAVPEFEPDEALAARCLAIAERLLHTISSHAASGAKE